MNKNKIIIISTTVLLMMNTMAVGLFVINRQFKKKRIILDALDK